LLLPSSGRSLDESRTAQDLEEELFHFEPTALRSGKLQYGAASGYHDDLVVALCLAYSQASFTPREPIFEVLDLDPVTAYGDPRESRFRWHIISRLFPGKSVSRLIFELATIQIQSRLRFLSISPSRRKSLVGHRKWRDNPK
jgi:hypothetical protein